MIAIGLAILAVVTFLAGVAGVIGRNAEVAIIGIGSGILISLLAVFAA